MKTANKMILDILMVDNDLPGTISVTGKPKFAIAP